MARGSIYLFDGIFFLGEKYYHNCYELSDRDGWFIIDNKCRNCKKEVPNKEKLEVMVGLKEVIGK